MHIQIKHFLHNNHHRIIRSLFWNFLVALRSGFPLGNFVENAIQIVATVVIGYLHWPDKFFVALTKSLAPISWIVSFWYTKYAFASVFLISDSNEKCEKITRKRKIRNFAWKVKIHFMLCKCKISIHMEYDLANYVSRATVYCVVRKL